MYQCLVCGFSFLEEEPYDESYTGSFEICGCCGFQYLILRYLINMIY